MTTFGIEITDKELYVEEDSEQNEPNVMSMSWASVVEEELRTSFEDKPLTGSLVRSSSEVSQTPNLSIDEILQQKPEQMDALAIMDAQCDIICSVRKTLRNAMNNEQQFDAYDEIKWILDGTEYLRKQLGLPEITHVKSKGIIRSSYKFCNFEHKCEYNYSMSRHRGCLAQHFVHNLLHADINSLLDHLSEPQEKQRLGEVKKSINTIHFVISHMRDELQERMNATFIDDPNVAHVERTPSAKNRNFRRRNRKKQKKSK